MHNVSIVQVFDRATGLNEEASYLGHAEELALLQGVGQRTIVADLQNNIRALFEREGPEELDYVGVSQFRVQLQFGYELDNVSDWRVGAGGLLSEPTSGVPSAT